MQIVEVRVCSENGEVCDTVAALNSAALVRVTSRNAGAIAADYTLTLSNCTYPAQPVPAQSVALAPDETKQVTFQVPPSSPQACPVWLLRLALDSAGAHTTARLQLYMTAADGAESAECTIDMLDSQSDITDTKQLNFVVNATVTDSLALSDGTREGLTGGDSGHRSCSDKCGGSMFNLVCFWWNSCKEELAKSIALIVGLLVFGAANARPHQRLHCMCCARHARSVAITWYVVTEVNSCAAKQLGNEFLLSSWCAYRPRACVRNSAWILLLDPDLALQPTSTQTRTETSRAHTK